MSIDFCDVVAQMRSHFFPRDRGITLLEGEFNGAGTVPVGGIILWSGAVGSIPTNWALCDGNNGTPNLTDRFIVGAGGAYAVGATGGASTNNLSHRHGDGTYTTANDTHNHSIGVASNTVPANDASPTINVPHVNHNHGGITGYDTHNHNITGDSDYKLSNATENKPPFYALCFIMRVT